MVADKFYSDECLRNTDYALVGGISIDELNSLEFDILQLLNFNLLIEQESIEIYYEKLMAFLALLKKSSRKKVVPEESKIRGGITPSRN